MMRLTTWTPRRKKVIRSVIESMLLRHEAAFVCRMRSEAAWGRP
jgi:hypothetical protein